MPADWHALMDRINAEVNLCKFKDDPPNEDNWDRMVNDEGDCDNDSVEKAERLAAAGLPIQRLRLATCFFGADGGRKQGRGHTVLVVDGPHEPYVLSQGREPLNYPQFVATGWMRHRIQKIGGSQEWVEWAA